MLPPFEPMAAAGPFQPLLQRGQYARQRMMTLGDLLLENRIVFVGASPDTGDETLWLVVPDPAGAAVVWLP